MDVRRDYQRIMKSHHNRIGLPDSALNYDEGHLNDVSIATTPVLSRTKVPPSRNVLPDEAARILTSWTSRARNESVLLSKPYPQARQPSWGKKVYYDQTPRLLSPTGLARQYQERRSKSRSEPSTSSSADSKVSQFPENYTKIGTERQLKIGYGGSVVDSYRDTSLQNVAGQYGSGQQQCEEDFTITKLPRVYDRLPSIENGIINNQGVANYRANSSSHLLRIHTWTLELEERVQRRWNDSQLARRFSVSHCQNGVEEWRNFEAPVWMIVVGPVFFILLLLAFLLSVVGTLDGTHLL